jgi:hypothetical protein
MLPSIYALAIWPVFQAGVIRYALANSWRALYELWRNIYFVYQNMGAFSVAMLVILLSRLILFAIVSPLLTATVLGTFAVPLIVLPLYYAFEWSPARTSGRYCASCEVSP